jgi:hypothetical protein
MSPQEKEIDSCLRSTCFQLKYAMDKLRWDEAVQCSIIIHNLSASLHSLARAKTEKREQGEWK